MGAKKERTSETRYYMGGTRQALLGSAPYMNTYERAKGGLSENTPGVGGARQGDLPRTPYLGACKRENREKFRSSSHQRAETCRSCQTTDHATVDHVISRLARASRKVRPLNNRD